MLLKSAVKNPKSLLRLLYTISHTSRHFEKRREGPGNEVENPHHPKWRRNKHVVFMRPVFSLSLNHRCRPLSLMNRAEVFGTLSKWKWPVVGVAAAFVGSMYTFGFNQSLSLQASNGQDDATNSLGLRDLLQKLIHNFLQGGKGPEKPPLSPKEASEILRRNAKITEVNIGVVSYFETNNFASNNPCEDRSNEWLLFKTNGAAFGVFDGHGGWQCAETVKNRLPLYLALSLLSKSDLTILERDLSKGFSMDDFVTIFQTDKSPVGEKSSKSNVGYTLSQKQEVFHTGPKYLVKNLLEKSFQGRMPAGESLSLAFTQLDDDISTEAIPVKVLDDSFASGATGACAIVSYIEGHDLFVANTGIQQLFQVIFTPQNNHHRYL